MKKKFLMIDNTETSSVNCEADSSTWETNSWIDEEEKGETDFLTEDEVEKKSVDHDTLDLLFNNVKDDLLKFSDVICQEYKYVKNVERIKQSIEMYVEKLERAKNGDFGQPKKKKKNMKSKFGDEFEIQFNEFLENTSNRQSSLMPHQRFKLENALRNPFALKKLFFSMKKCDYGKFRKSLELIRRHDQCIFGWIDFEIIFQISKDIGDDPKKVNVFTQMLLDLEENHFKFTSFMNYVKNYGNSFKNISDSLDEIAIMRKDPSIRVKNRPSQRHFNRFDKFRR